jgi:hypothetical protein
MGRREDGQGQFFYSFDLDRVVPTDHLVRQIDGLLDLGWIHEELAPITRTRAGVRLTRIRMLLVGYVFAIRSERRIAVLAISHRRSTQDSALPGCDGMGRCAMPRAPRPIPLHQRANKAQTNPGLYPSLDERRGSGQDPPRLDRGSERLDSGIGRQVGVIGVVSRCRYPSGKGSSGRVRRF